MFIVNKVSQRVIRDEKLIFYWNFDNLMVALAILNTTLQF